VQWVEHGKCGPSSALHDATKGLEEEGCDGLVSAPFPRSLQK
jgi:hypothetical protein